MHKNVAAQARADGIRHCETLRDQHEDVIRPSNIAAQRQVNHERRRVQHEADERSRQEVDRVCAEFAAATRTTRGDPPGSAGARCPREPFQQETERLTAILNERAMRDSVNEAEHVQTLRGLHVTYNTLMVRA